MSIAESRIEDPEAAKTEWVDRLGELVSLTQGYVEASGWRTRRVTKPVTEPGLGRYEVPLLIMERSEVEVILSPIARGVPGTEGLVDLCLMPGYDDEACLTLDGDRWFILSPDSRDPFDERSINRVLGAIAGRA